MSKSQTPACGLTTIEIVPDKSTQYHVTYQIGTNVINKMSSMYVTTSLKKAVKHLATISFIKFINNIVIKIWKLVYELFMSRRINMCLM